MDRMVKNNFKVDCVLTDPPYNVGGTATQQIRWNSKKLKTVDEIWDNFSQDEFLKFNFDWISKSQKVLKENGNIIIFGSMHNMYQVGYILQKLGFKINNHITWFKRNAPPNISCRTLTHSCEYAIWAVNGDTKWTFNYKLAKEKNNNKQQRDLYTIDFTDFVNYIMTPNNEKLNGKHATQKPLELIKDMIQIFTNENDIVFDPFVGSGTTAVASKLLKRQYICCDKEQEYIEITKKRLQEIAINVKFYRRLII